MIGILIRPPQAEMITPKYDPEWAERTKRIIEECGRVSHKSEGRIKEGSADPFIQKIALDYGHESILEHGSFTACLIGSRSMSHQLVRHRIAAITQESQRFCDYASEKKQEDADNKLLQVIMPPSIMRSKGLWGKRVMQPSASRPQDMLVDGQPILSFLEDVAKREALPKEAVEDAFDWCVDQLHSYRGYLRMRDRGIPAEDARSDLTNACKTEVYITYNWRTWRHVIGHPKCGRALNDHAQWEIKGLFLACLRFFKENIPLLFNDMELPPEHEVFPVPGA